MSDTAACCAWTPADDPTVATRRMRRAGAIALAFFRTLRWTAIVRPDETGNRRPRNIVRRRAADRRLVDRMSRAALRAAVQAVCALAHRQPQLDGPSSFSVHKARRVGRNGRAPSATIAGRRRRRRNQGNPSLANLSNLHRVATLNPQRLSSSTMRSAVDAYAPLRRTLVRAIRATMGHRPRALLHLVFRSPSGIGGRVRDAGLRSCLACA